MGAEDPPSPRGCPRAQGRARPGVSEDRRRASRTARSHPESWHGRGRPWQEEGSSWRISWARARTPRPAPVSATTESAAETTTARPGARRADREDMPRRSPHGARQPRVHRLGREAGSRRRDQPVPRPGLRLPPRFPPLCGSGAALPPQWTCPGPLRCTESANLTCPRGCAVSGLTPRSPGALAGGLREAGRCRAGAPARPAA